MADIERTQVRIRDLKVNGQILPWPIAIDRTRQAYYAATELPIRTDATSPEGLEYSNRGAFSGREQDGIPAGPVVDLSAGLRREVVFLDGENGGWVKTYWLKEDEAYHFFNDLGVRQNPPNFTGMRSLGHRESVLIPPDVWIGGQNV